MALISAFVLIPCFWQRRIEAGDLPSHTYNAWLCALVEQGNAPGLYIQSQWNNIVIDLALEKLGGAVGYIAAERAVVAISVLVFFWGAFAFITAANHRPPWLLVPAIAMITYGWTFYSGFMNFYLSVGLSCLAVALFWRGGGLDLLVGAALAFFALIAHPAGFLCVLGLATYFRLGELLQGWRRWGLFACAWIVVVGIHYYAIHARTAVWHRKDFLVMNGTDQLMLFDDKYVRLAYLTAIFCGFSFVNGLLRRKKLSDALAVCRPTLEMWLLSLSAAAVIPEVWWFPRYPVPLEFAISRLTVVTAVLGLCVLGSVTPRLWHFLGLSVLATLFFAWTYQYTKILNDMESQTESLIRSLPQGRRVIETINTPGTSRILFGQHILERACIGKCFEYANYEPSSKVFRMRVLHGSPIVTDSVEDSIDMQSGSYIVRQEDLPMNQIYQCDGSNPWKLCIRELSAGEENGRLNVQAPRIE